MGSSPLVSIVLVTRRAGFLPYILRLIDRQDHSPREVVLVLHGLERKALPRPTQRLVEAAARTVLELGPDLPLGTCLNEGIAAARGDILAKMDDDDLYGRRYLSEAVQAMRTHAVPVVGKVEHFVYRVPQRELMLWGPGAAWLEQDFLTGPSLVFEAHLGRTPGFRPVGLAEERYFAEDCRRKGHRLLATSRRNLVVRRFSPEHHTWQPSEQVIAARGIVLRRGFDLAPDHILQLAGNA
jgi:glycosyltransferase involved in cell wall biosynthesis